jgi:tetratricopeptide (TPR) repeat protein
VLSGAYRASGGRLILASELAEAKSGRVIWAKDLKGRIAGVIDGGDELIDQLVAEASGAVLARELERSQTQSLPTLESYTLLMGAIALMHRLSLHDFDRAREMLQALIDRAPRLAIPLAWLGKWHVLRVWQGWSSDPNADRQFALECTKRALDVDPYCSLALVIDGMVHTNLLKKLDVAKERYDAALSVNPNDPLAWLLLGTLEAFKGQGKAAMKDTQHAIRLSPLDPQRYFYDALAATAALSARKYEQAIKLTQQSLRANRTHASTLRAMAIAQWELGRREEARKTVADLMKVEPTLTITGYLDRSPSSGFETGKIWSNALRSAGVPE